MNPSDSSIHAWKTMAVRSGMCLLLGTLGWALASLWPTVSTAAFMFAFLFGGWDLTREVWIDLRRLHFDTHFLMILVVPGSVAVGALGFRRCHRAGRGGSHQ